MGRMHAQRAAVMAAGFAVFLAACSGGQDPDAVSSTTPPTAQDEDASVQRVPDVEVETFDGATTTLADHADIPMVVNFWASWCPPCVAEMPDLEAVHQATAGQVAFVGVNTQDSPDAAARLVEETGVSYDLVRDPDGGLFRALEVFGMPSTFYVDADGVIVGRHTGLITRDDLLADLVEHFDVEVGEAS